MIREEIKEGIRQRYLARWVSALEPDVAEGMLQDAEAFTGQILSYLHSQGVVIKAEGELPRVVVVRILNESYLDGCHEVEVVVEPEQWQAMKAAGYVAVEPLIEG